MGGKAIGGPIRLPDGSTIPLAKGIRAGPFVFVSGQIGVNEKFQLAGEGVEEQTRQCLENVRSILAAASCTLADVVKTSVWLTDPSLFKAFNATYSTFFPDGPPARSTVCSALMVPGAVVEIDAVAYRP